MYKETKIPKLRFPEFTVEWIPKKIGDYYKKLRTGMTPYRGKPEYYTGDILWISSGELNRGYISDTKEKITKQAVLDTNLEVYPPNTLFIAITGLEASGTRGKCAINLLPATTNQSCMAFDKREDIYTLFLFYWYHKYGESLYFKYAQGTKQQSFNNSLVEIFDFVHPLLPEQQKIASFLRALDDKIVALTKKKELLVIYKNGIMQQIFSQDLRFKDDDGTDFSDWKELQLKDILTEHKSRNSKYEVKEVFSVAKHRGVINQIEHLGRSYASKETGNYKVAFPNDVIYTKSPTSDFPYGIVKQNKLNRTGIVSVLYGVFTPINKDLGLLLDYYFSNWRNTFNYLNPLVQKGAKNTMNIGNDDFLNGAEIMLPTSQKEQSKISNFLAVIDEKIDHTKLQIEKTELYKKGLLQQMFV